MFFAKRPPQSKGRVSGHPGSAPEFTYHRSTKILFPGRYQDQRDRMQRNPWEMGWSRLGPRNDLNGVEWDVKPRNDCSTMLKKTQRRCERSFISDEPINSCWCTQKQTNKQTNEHAHTPSDTAPQSRVQRTDQLQAAYWSETINNTEALDR